MKPSPPIFERNGEILAVQALGIVLYGRTADLTEHLDQVLPAALDLIEPHCTWLREGEESRNRAWTAADRERLRLSPPVAAANRTVQLRIDSGTTLDSVGPWSLECALGPTEEHDLLSYLIVHMDETWAVTQSEHIVDLLALWGDRGRFLHGCAAISVNFDLGDISKDRNLAVRAHCERFLGVMCTDQVTERTALTCNVKGVQWLAYLSNELVDSCSGLREQIAAEPLVRCSERGLIVSTGPSPLLHDVNRMGDLNALHRANSLIAGLLVDSVYPLPGFPDEGAVGCWLARWRGR